MRDKIKKRLGEKRVLIPLIISVLVFTGLGIWWYNANQYYKTLQGQYEAKFVEKVLNNLNEKEVVSVDNFIQKLKKQEVEKGEIYRQYREKEYGAIVKYYVKFKGGSQYYLVYAPVGYMVLMETVSGFVGIPLDTFINEGPGMPGLKVMTTEPKAPNQIGQYVAMAIFLVLFILILYFILFRVGAGRGFTKAQLQEAKKPVYFADVGGVDEALDESREIADMIKAKGGSGKWQ